MPNSPNGDSTPEADITAESSTRFSNQSITDGLALTLVNSTYERYRIWRYRNHDLRWNTADALFVGWMPQRFWEGTRVPRSSLGVPIAFDQVQSAYPVIMNALFGDDQWFECDPIGGTTVEEARQQTERLQYLLENPRSRMGGTARNDIRLAVLQILKYGNGIINVEHDGDTGQPTVVWTDVKDVYVDPGCATPSIDDSLSVVHRDFLTLDELESLRDTPGISLPDRDTLRRMTAMRPSDTGDITKQNQEAYRNVAWRPGYDDSTDFAPDKTIEVLRYYSKSRIIWVLQRRWVAYNELNPYGFVTYCAAPCYIMDGRMYGMGIPDAIEGNQKYSQAILNGHLDELSLMLNPPRARKRSGAMTQGSSITRPGQMWEVENPKEDMIFFPPQGVTKDGWQELAWMEQSSEKRTGVNSTMSSGGLMRSNASRTATGVQAQTSGPTTRIQAIVELIEDYMIVPMLYKLLAMDTYHNTGSAVPGLSPTGGLTSVPSAALRAPVKFRIKASSRMLTQSRLQAIAPFLQQYLMNGAFLAQLAKTGQTIDFEEFFRLIQDATGTRNRYRLIRSMTEDEKQGMGKPSPEAMIKQQTAKEQSQERIQIANIGAQSKRDAAAVMASKADEDSALKLLTALGGLDQTLGVGTGGALPGAPSALAGAAQSPPQGGGGNPLLQALLGGMGGAPPQGAQG